MLGNRASANRAPANWALAYRAPANWGPGAANWAPGAANWAPGKSWCGKLGLRNFGPKSYKYSYTAKEVKQDS